MISGIILAGGKSTRLHDLTTVTNKHMLPIGKYPMIYYPIFFLRSFGIKNIFIVTGKDHAGDMYEILNDGSKFNCNFNFAVQNEADGIFGALKLAKKYIGNDYAFTMLGDNIINPYEFHSRISKDNLYNRTIYSNSTFEQSIIFTKFLNRGAEKFGVVTEYDSENNIKKIVEKPKYREMGDVVTGIYLYRPNVIQDNEFALEKSSRGEYEITDVNNNEIANHRLSSIDIGNTFWSDAGTLDSYKKCNEYAWGNFSDNLFDFCK